MAGTGQGVGGGPGGSLGQYKWYTDGVERNNAFLHSEIRKQMHIQNLHHSTVGTCHLPEKCENEAGCNVSLVPAGGVGPGYGGAAGGGFTGE